MIKFEVRAENGIGLIEPIGELSDSAIPDLRDAIARAQQLANSFKVVIIEDGIKATSEPAATVLIAECKTLRAKAGDLVLVSTDGALTMRGRPSSATLFMTACNSLQTAQRVLDKTLASADA